MNPLLAVTIAAIVLFLIAGTGSAVIDRRITEAALTRPQYEQLNRERERWRIAAAFGWYTAIFGIVAGIYRALAA